MSSAKLELQPNIDPEQAGDETNESYKFADSILRIKRRGYYLVIWGMPFPMIYTYFFEDDPVYENEQYLMRMNHFIRTWTILYEK